MKTRIISIVALVFVILSTAIAADTDTVSHPIDQYEYWFNNDFDGKTQTAVAATKLLHVNTLLSTDELDNGLNTLHFRACDTTKTWSSTTSVFFYKNASKTTNQIIAYEYWFNDGYIGAEYKTVSSTDLLNINDLLSTDTLDNGLNTLHVRVKNSLGTWSGTNSMFFYKNANKSASQIIAYEYWFNDGYSVAEYKTVSSTNLLYINDLLSTDTLDNGLNTVHVRVKNSLGAWSGTNSMFFYKNANKSANQIIAYEYWFNDGYSDAEYKTVAATDLLSIKDLLSTDILDNGLNTVHVRVKNSLGAWSGTNSLFFYKTKEIMSGTDNQIVAYEYWLNDQYDNAIEVATTSATQVVQLSDSLDFSSTDKGKYALNIRFRDAAGLWSAVLTDSIQVNTLTSLESTFQNLVIVYPNPTTGSFKIELGQQCAEVSISISDLKGHQIQQYKETNASVINMSIAQPPGIYLITVRSGNEKAVLRLVKRM